MSILNYMVRRMIADHGDRPALHDRDALWSFAEFGTQINKTARAFRTVGLSRGDRIALFMRNCNQWMSSEFGCLAVGIGFVPVNQRFNAEEVVWVVNNSQSSAIVFSPHELSIVAKVHEELPALTYLCVNGSGKALPEWAVDLDRVIADSPDEPVAEEVADTDLARIMYTSATTGTPKGVVIDHDHWRSNCIQLLLHCFFDVGPEDAYLAVTPLTHMAGGWAWFTLLKGGKVVIAEKWHPESFASDCAEHGITLLMMAPTLFVGLLRQLDERPDQLEICKKLKLKKIMYGASPIPESLSNRVEELFGRILWQFYGYTENIGNGTGMSITTLHPERHSDKRETAGLPQSNTWVRVVDDEGNDLPPGEVGEIVSKTWRPGGIWNNPEATAKVVRGEWIHSGDVGFFDEDGFLTVTDRKSDMLISGGLNVYPTEIENVLAQLPQIAEAKHLAPQAMPSGRTRMYATLWTRCRSMSRRSCCTTTPPESTASAELLPERR